MKPTLYLHEETLLLALRDREGTVTASPHYLYALGGALLAELVLAQRVRLGPGRRSPRVELVNPAPIGEVLLDECLTRIAHAKRARSARDWVMRFASLKRLKHRVAAELCQRGILRAAPDRCRGTR